MDLCVFPKDIIMLTLICAKGATGHKFKIFSDAPKKQGVPAGGFAVGKDFSGVGSSKKSSLLKTSANGADNILI